jgi:WD40 repeat protein
MAFSPDGRLLATGWAAERSGPRDASTDSVRLWDVATGKLVRSLCPARAAPAFLVFSPGGELLATSGDWKRPPQLWDVATGKEVRKLAGHDDPQRDWSEFNPVAFSPDGGLVATGGRDNLVVLWETATGGEVRLLRGHTRPVRSLAFSPDGRKLVSGGGDTTALVWPLPPEPAPKWDPDKASRLWNALESEAAVAYPAVWALAAAPEPAVPFLKERLRPDPTVDDRQVARWIADLGDKEFKVREEGMRNLREAGPVVEEALRKALEGQDDLERRRRLKDLIAALEDREPDKQLLRDLRAVRALEQMGTAAAEEVLEGLARGPETGPRARAARAALVRLDARRQPGRRRAPAPGPAPEGRKPRQLYAHDAEVYAVAFTPDGTAALSAGRDGKVRRWDVAAAKELPALPGHEGGTFALAVAPDGKVLAAAGADGQVRLWDLVKGEAAGSLDAHKGGVFAVAFSPDGKWLASGGADGLARLWDAEKKEERHRLEVSRERVTAVAFSADGETLLTAGVHESGSTYDGKPCTRFMPEPVKLWKVATGALVRRGDQEFTTLGAAGKQLLLVRMNSATIGGDGDKGWSNVTTGVVSLADAAGDKPRLVVGGHGGAAAFSPAAGLLATARGSDLHVGERVRYDRVPAGADDLRVWEVASGQEVLRWAGDPPTALAFSPDGTHLLFGTRGGAACLVETAPPGVGEGGRPDRKTLDGLWADLGSADAAVAYRAGVVLAAAKEDAPAFLAGKLAPAPADDAELVRLIADLDAARYVARRSAFAKLARRGAEAEPALRAAVARERSAAVKLRLEELLALPGIKVFPDPLRRRRATLVLERIGTAEAKRVLDTLPPIPEPTGP